MSRPITDYFTEYRPDGWPLCPQCGEDELYSHLIWDGCGERPPLEDWIEAGIGCYVCQWFMKLAPGALTREEP